MNLFELVGERLALQNKLEVLNFDDECILDTLEGNSAELAAKVENYGFVIKNRMAFVDAMAVEIDRMMARREAELNRIDAIEKWLLESMVACNYTKMEGPAFTISVQKNPAKVEVLEESAVPKDYWKTPEPKPPVSSPDKKKILDAMKAGEDVAGCRITRTARLVIK
jgi:hypothetical protein